VVLIVAPEVRLRPGTMVVLGLGQYSPVARWHGARWGTAAHAASSGSSSGSPFESGASCEFGRRLSPRGAADCGGCCFFVDGKVRWWCWLLGL
jgi:hypothetical protein